MVISLDTVQVWSKEAQKKVDWTVSVEDVVDVQPDPIQVEPPKVVVVRYGDEIYRFSPNITDEELQKQIEIINQENK